MSSEILLSITGKNLIDFKSKLKEINFLSIKRVSLFLEFYNKKQRKEIYKLLKKSCIKELPFIHARHDMEPKEYIFFIKNFKTKYFNLHIDCFNLVDEMKLNKIKNRILYEHSFHNTIKKTLDMKKIGGFCIDLSHFKSSQARDTNEHKFVISHKQNKKLFIANHLNGYDPIEKKDMHWIKNIKDFDYIKTMPKFIFGRYISLEMFNSIKEQVKYKKYLVPILKKKIKIK